MRFILLLILFISVGCSHIEKFNAVEGKILYEEHYATFNDIDYESGESETFGAAVTSKKIYDKGYGFDYSIYPDVSFESSKLKPRNPNDQLIHKQIKMRRLSAFLGARGSFYSIVGIFDLNVEVGPSYTEAYNDTLNTSKVEPTFRYEGAYTLFFIKGLYGTVSFTFQESTDATYSEYYSLMYKLGYRF